LPRSLRIRPLPQNPSLEQLEKQAKDPLASLHQGEQAALHRVTRCVQVTEANRTTFWLTPERLSASGVRHVAVGRGADARVAHFSPHDLRRTFISDLLDAGATSVGSRGACLICP
jgi:integrase